MNFGSREISSTLRRRWLCNHELNDAAIYWLKMRVRDLIALRLCANPLSGYTTQKQGSE